MISISSAALIALNFVEQRDPAGSVTECMDEQLCFNLAFATGVTKAPGRQCVVSVQTEDGSATVGQSLMTIIFSHNNENFSTL